MKLCLYIKYNQVQKRTESFVRDYCTFFNFAKISPVFVEAWKYTFEHQRRCNSCSKFNLREGAPHHFTLKKGGSQISWIEPRNIQNTRQGIFHQPFVRRYDYRKQIFDRNWDDLWKPYENQFYLNSKKVNSGAGSQSESGIKASKNQSHVHRLQFKNFRFATLPTLQSHLEISFFLEVVSTLNVTKVHRTFIEIGKKILDVQIPIDS